MHALFSFHRHRPATWYYLIICLRSLDNHQLMSTLVLALAHITGCFGDIYRSSLNHISDNVRRLGESFITRYWGRHEVIVLLRAVDEEGFQRGQIGECIHSLIDLVEHRDHILGFIVFDASVDEEIRNRALLLLIYYESPEGALELINAYWRRFPGADRNGWLVEMKRMIEEHGDVWSY